MGKIKVDEKFIKEIGEFDNAFADGIFAVPRNPNEPRVKVRALLDYCQEKGVEPSELSLKEREQFLAY